MLRPHCATLVKPVVPGSSAQMFVPELPHSHPVPEPMQQLPPVEHEVSGPLLVREHVQPLPLAVVSHATVRQSQLVPASGQSRSAQQRALGTVLEAQAIESPPAAAAVQRHDLPSLGSVQVVAEAGVSPGGPSIEGVPHAASHFPRRQLASWSLATDALEGYATARQAAPPDFAQPSTSVSSLRHAPSPQH